MKLKFIDPNQIMSAIVALIILSVGVFAFFITVSNIPVTTPAHNVTNTLQNATYFAVINISQTGNQVFNIIGVVLIIAAIMSIVGLVYSYIKPHA
jgi:hypothetical protein